MACVCADNKGRATRPFLRFSFVPPYVCQSFNAILNLCVGNLSIFFRRKFSHLTSNFLGLTRCCYEIEGEKCVILGKWRGSSARVSFVCQTRCSFVYLPELIFRWSCFLPLVVCLTYRLFVLYRFLIFFARNHSLSVIWFSAMYQRERFFLQHLYGTLNFAH